MACRDRLADLLAAADNNSSKSNTRTETTSLRTMPSMASATDPWRASDIGDFLEEVNAIRGQLFALEEQVNRLEHKHADLLTCMHREQQQTLGEELSTVVVDINTKASRIRGALRVMNDDNKEFERTSEPADDGLPADVRIRVSQHSALSRKFAAVMLRFAEIRDSNAERRKQLATRMCELGLCLKDFRASPEALDDEQLVQAQRTMELEAEVALSDVAERHRQLAALERDMMDLHAMFTDLSILVEEQGEALDRIDLNVDRAAVYVDHSRMQLKQAKKLKSSIRKKSFAIGTVVVVAAAAVAAAITAPIRAVL